MSARQLVNMCNHVCQRVHVRVSPLLVVFPFFSNTFGKKNRGDAGSGNALCREHTSFNVRVAISENLGFMFGWRLKTKEGVVMKGRIASFKKLLCVEGV